MLSQDLINEITTLLNTRWQTPVTVEFLNGLDSQYIVARCRIAGNHADLPLNVIVKKWELQGEASEFQAPPSPERFYREQDSLQFLSKLLADNSLAPRVLASDRSAGLLIMEDLGDNPTVQDILFDDNVQNAQQRLIQVAKQMARLHGASLGQEGEFDAITQGSAAMPVDAASDLREANLLSHLQTSLTGMQAGELDKSALTSLEATLHNPADFRTLTHCDAGVHNFLAIEDDVRIMDFEFARYANGFLDLACLRLGFPVAFKAHRIPPSLLTEIENAYRTTLTAYYSPAQDDKWFRQMMSAACTHWALVWMMNIWRGYVIHRIPGGEAYDREGQRSPEVMAMFRQKCLTYLTVALETAEEYNLRTPLHAVMETWRACFMEHFPDTELLPYYPVFRD